MRIYPANSLHEEVKRWFKLPGYLKLILGKRSTLVMRFVAILLAVALIQHLASAKRIAPASVEPVVYEGIRYVAPNDDGRRGYIEAWDVKTNKKLWELTVYTNRIDPKLEADVQWVFINKLTIRDEMLMVTSERGATYQVDLRTKAITQWSPTSSPAHGANEQPHDIPDVIKRAITTSSLARNYDLSFRINPFYLRGDLNGDGKIDVAALVKQRSTGKLGIAIIHGEAEKATILGAGTAIGNGGDDFEWMDSWQVYSKGRVALEGGEKSLPHLRGDALLVSKSEAASALIYWNGEHYVWLQQGD
jgi:hypothetical protein